MGEPRSDGEHRAQRLEPFEAQADAPSVEQHRRDAVVGGGLDLELGRFRCECAQVELGPVAVIAGGNAGGAGVDGSEPSGCAIIGQPGRMTFNHERRGRRRWRHGLSRLDYRVVCVTRTWGQGLP